MIEIKVLPAGDKWTWKLRQTGRAWVCRKETAIADKKEVRRSAMRMAKLLGSYGHEVKIDLGYTRPCEKYQCGHGVKVVAC